MIWAADFGIPHTKHILLSDLEVFELLDEKKSGLIIGVATDERETIVAYVVSPRQCGEIGHRSWKKYLDSLKKAKKWSLMQIGLQRRSQLF
jgi:hypothetical protein